MKEQETSSVGPNCVAGSSHRQASPNQSLSHEIERMIWELMLMPAV